RITGRYCHDRLSFLKGLRLWILWISLGIPAVNNRGEPNHKPHVGLNCDGHLLFIGLDHIRRYGCGAFTIVGCGATRGVSWRDAGVVGLIVELYLLCELEIRMVLGQRPNEVFASSNASPVFNKPNPSVFPSAPHGENDPRTSGPKKSL